MLTGLRDVKDEIFVNIPMASLGLICVAVEHENQSKMERCWEKPQVGVLALMRTLTYHGYNNYSSYNQTYKSPNCIYKSPNCTYKSPNWL